MNFSYLGAQAISRAEFWSFIFAMWMRNHNFGTPPKEGAIFRTNPFYPYISNVPVQSGPARRSAWRQRITVTALIEPRINNVKKQKCIVHLTILNSCLNRMVCWPGHDSVCMLGIIRHCGQASAIFSCAALLF